MRHLLALLHDGTRGTSAEPAGETARVLQNDTSKQRLASVGTRGTLRTPEIEPVSTHDTTAQRVADLADTYAERIAICLEAGDIGEDEARRIAEAEIGAAFVRIFLSGDVAPSRKQAH